MTGDARSNGPERGRGLPGRVFGAVVGSVVDPVVERIDVEDVVDRIDIDGVVARIDVDALLGRVDVDAILDRIDVNRVLDRVEADRLLDRVDPDRLLDRVSPDRLLDRVDPDRLLDRVSPDRLLDRVDPDRLLDRVDPDRLLDRVDLDRVLDRVDLDRVLGRVDLDAVLARVDVDAIVERIDIDRLVERTELRTIIARSTTGVFTEALDVARTQFANVDQNVQAVGGTLARPRRGRDDAPGTPSAPDERPQLRGLSRREKAVALQGHHAGSVSRFMAFLVDVFVVGLLFAAGSALVGAAIDVLTRQTISLDEVRWLVVVVWAGWSFLYFAGSWAATGRTIGMTLLGVMVVDASGGEVGSRRAALRAVCFPLSFVLFGAGFLVGLFRGDRRELHDLLAGTAVIYAWDATEAQLRAEAIASRVSI